MTWPAPPLGSLVETIVPARDKPKDLTGPIPWVRSEDFDGKWLDGSTSGQGVTEETAREMPLRLFPEGAVVCSCSCEMGKTAITTRSLVTNQTYIGLVPRRDAIDAEFLYYSLQGHGAELNAMATGAIQTYLSRDDFRGLRLPVPDLNTQRAIADFLDTETTRIDALIAKKQQLVERLAERRVAAIDQLFERQPERPRLSHLLVQSPCYGVLKPDRFDGSGAVPCIRISEIGASGELQMSEVVTISPAQHAEYRRTQLNCGDVLLSCVGTLGRTAVVGREAEGANVSRAVARLAPRADIDPRYLCLWTETSEFRRTVDLVVNITAQPVLNMGDLSSMRVPVPATLAETRDLTELVAAALKPIEGARGRMKTQMRLLAEHRQALITAAVTGKLNVPGVAA